MKKALIFFVSICIALAASGCNEDPHNTVKGKLELVGPDEKVLLSKDDFAYAAAEQGAMTEKDKYCVVLHTTKKGKKLLADATSELTGQSISIYLEDELLLSARIMEALDEGEFILKDNMDNEEAQKLCDVINNGE